MVQFESAICKTGDYRVVRDHHDGASLPVKFAQQAQNDFFVRGVIEIPVHDYEHEFGWGVWVSHKKKNFETYRQNFDRPSIGPFFGWLCTEINYYPETTLHLKTMAHYRGQGLRPSIVLDEADHLLYRHQRDGISLSEAWRIVHERREWNAEIARKRELDDLRAKTGQKRANSLSYARDGDDYLVVASKGGDPKAPGGYHNLKANPKVEINVGPKRFAVTDKPVLPADPDYARL